MKQIYTFPNGLPAESRRSDLPEAYDGDYGIHGGNSGNQFDDKAHWQELIFSLRKHRWMILAVTVLITAAVAVFMARQPNVYEAAAQVQVDLDQTNSNTTTTKAGTAIITATDPAYFNTQVQYLSSSRLLRNVVKDLELDRNPNFSVAAKQSSWFGFFGTAAKASTSFNDSPADLETTEEVTKEELAEATRLAPYVEALRTSLTVEPVKETRLPVKETRLIDLTFTHTDPQLAARIVNRIVDTFVAGNMSRKTGNSKSASDVLEQRIGELQAQIRLKENELLAYAKNHQILSLDANQNTVVERLVNLNRQLLEAENERKVAEAAYNAALTPGAADALASTNAREAQEIETRLSQLWQRRSQLMVDFTPAWPEVKEIDNQIAALDKQAKQVRNRASSIVLTNLRTQFRQASARESALRTAYDQQRAETLAQNEAAVNYRILQQEIETNRGLLDGILQKSKENEAALATLRNNIQVSDHAIVPTNPIGPRRFLITGVAFALSLGFAVALAVFRGHIDDSVRSTADLERTLQVRPLAAIPSLNAKDRSPHEPAVFLEPNGDHQAELVLDAPSGTPFMEAYRYLRTTLLLSARRGQMKSLLVTSSLAGEGKTTTAVNTAISLARTGALVVIVDADLRRPRLHQVFQLSNDKGLTTILSQKFDERDPLRFVEHFERRLCLMPAGPVSPDSVELLGSEQMRKLIESLERIYDYVIIDSPPLSHFTDAVLLSALVDQVLLVVDTKKCTRATVRHSCQLLQDAGATTLGVVVNNFKAPKNRLNYPVEYSAAKYSA